MLTAAIPTRTLTPEQALAWGYTPIPLRATGRTKAPRPEEWQRRDFTPAEWLPREGVGLRTGLQRDGSYFYAVDYDHHPEDGDDAPAQLQAALDRMVPGLARKLPTALSTGGRGRYILFRARRHVPTVAYGEHHAGRPWRGEFLSDGRQVVAPTPGRMLSGRLDALPILEDAELDALLRAIGYPEPTPVHQRAPEAPTTRCSGAVDLIAAYNRETDLLVYLEACGGRTRQRIRRDKVVMQCPCGGHPHGDRHPSLELRRAKVARYGKWVAIGHSSNCLFHTERGQVIDAYEAARRLEGAPALRAPTHPLPTPLPEPPATPTAEQITRRAAEAERKREGRREEAAATLAQIRERMTADVDLPKHARRVLTALLEVAGERSWCRPSVAQLQDRTGYGERRVQQALRILEARGYIRSDDRHDGSTWQRTFIWVQKLPACPAQIAPELRDQENLSPSPDLACVGGGAQPVPTPEPAGDVVAFPGGASYDPAAAIAGELEVPRRSWKRNRLPGNLYRNDDRACWEEARRRWHQAWESGPAAADVVDLGDVGEQHALALQADDQAGPEEESPATFPVLETAASVTRRPPSDPQKRRTYYGLMGKADKIARANPKQAEALRRKACELEELEDTPTAPARSHARPAAARGSSTGKSASVGIVRPPSQALVSQAEVDPHWVELQRWQAVEYERRGDYGRAAFVRAAAGLGASP